MINLSATAQDQALADSLIHELSRNKNLTDSIRFFLYFNIAGASVHPDEIITYSTKAIEVVKEKKLKLDYKAPALIYLGRGLMQKGDLINAIQLFFQAAQAYQKVGKPLGVGTAYDYIARAYRMQNHHAQAIDYYKKSLQIFTAEKDSVRLSNVLLNTGYLYYKANALDSALYYTQKAGDLFRKINEEFSLAYAIGNIGLIYASMKHDKKAEDHLHEALLILSKYKDDYAITEYLAETAAIYESRRNFNKALYYADSSFVIAKRNGFKEFIRDSSLKLSKIHAQLNNHQQAYKYQNVYIAYRDSINNEETIRKMADLRTEFEVAQKQADIDHLNEDKRKQQIILVGLTITVLLACILIFILFLYNRQKQLSNKLLAQQNSELEQQRNELQCLVNTRNRFFSIISHDLRGPVNAFNGISSLIRHYISNNDLKQLGEISEYIDKSASQLSSLLDNLLSWSVIQQGEFPYRPEQLSLKSLLHENIAIFRTMAHAKNIKLESTIEDDITLWADSNSMLTILRNLTSNAVKFTHEGGAVTLSARALNGFAEIKVEDTGIGMPPERLNALFTLREEKRTWGTSGEKGLGIGLRLAYDFAEMNKGTIHVSSRVGMGTTFIVRLPLYMQPSLAKDHDARFSSVQKR